MNLKVGKRTIVLGSFTTVLALLLGVALFGAAGITGWEYSNSDHFCGTMCHDVHPEEIVAHKTNSHARVRCVECHMGRNSTLKLMAIKPTKWKELYGMVFGYDRPITAHGLRPSNEACESCHFPTIKHNDTIVAKVHYDTDTASSEQRTTLVLHTGMDTVRQNYTRGIHWHVANEVRFVSPDPQRREIPWVQVVKPDGSTVTYTDAETTLTAEQIAALPARPMACYDCHNAVGHPFPNPANIVDEAIRTGRIDRSMPDTKARAQALVDKLEDITGRPEDRGAKIDALIAESATQAATPPEHQAAEKKFNTAMREILMTASFLEKGFSWKTFPDHTGHADTPGCFRCHNGKHYNEQGEAIRLQCTLCHALPQVERENGKGSVPSLLPEKAAELQPESHQRPNFMHTHADDVSEDCEVCHGAPLRRGSRGGTFCSNPACHGRDWPGMNISVEPKTTTGLPALREKG